MELNEKTTVLIIDDDEKILRGLSCLMEKEFFVHKAANAMAGLAVIDRAPVSVVLLDLNFPDTGMNGVEALRAIRKKCPYMKVIVITGSSSHDWAKECADLNVQGYMEKPFDPLALMERIKGLSRARNYNFLKTVLEEGRGQRVSNLSSATQYAICYIENNCHRNFTRDELAAYLNLAPDYLSRLFKKECRISLKNYISRVKIHKCKEYLSRVQSMKIKDVAQSIGIPDLVYFCRFFKKHTGHTPREFRKKSLRFQ